MIGGRRLGTGWGRGDETLSGIGFLLFSSIALRGVLEVGHIVFSLCECNRCIDFVFCYFFSRMSDHMSECGRGNAYKIRYSYMFTLLPRQVLSYVPSVKAT